jgi:hypothetical protein
MGACTSTDDVVLYLATVPRYCWFREEQNKNHRNRGMETVQEFVQKWRSGASEPTPVS